MQKGENIETAYSQIDNQLQRRNTGNVAEKAEGDAALTNALSRLIAIDEKLSGTESKPKLYTTSG